MPLDGSSQIQDERIPAYAVREFDGMLYAYLGETPYSTLGVLADTIDVAAFDEISYAVHSEHWIHALAREAALAKDLNESLQIIMPNFLLIDEGGAQARIIAEVPIDELNTLQLSCRVGLSQQGGHQPVSPTETHFIKDAVDGADYGDVIDLIGAKARAFGTDAPECNCSGDLWSENFHTSLSNAVKDENKSLIDNISADVSPSL
jgi:hypothetical protein